MFESFSYQIIHHVILRQSLIVVGNIEMWYEWKDCRKCQMKILHDLLHLHPSFLVRSMPKALGTPPGLHSSRLSTLYLMNFEISSQVNYLTDFSQKWNLSKKIYSVQFPLKNHRIWFSMNEFIHKLTRSGYQ